MDAASDDAHRSTLLSIRVATETITHSHLSASTASATVSAAASATLSAVQSPHACDRFNSAQPSLSCAITERHEWGEGQPARHQTTIATGGGETAVTGAVILLTARQPNHREQR